MSCDPEDKSRPQERPEGEASAGSAADSEMPPTDTADGCRTHKVDLLFVIDNSGSMGEEQAKLARTVPQLLGILATGNRNGKRSAAGEPTDFAPADSIHVGVISTDMGINRAPSLNSCGDRSFAPTDPDPRVSAMRLNKPFGDDGLLLSSTEVAETGITVPQFPDFDLSVVVPPDPSCADLALEEPYLSYEPGELFEDTGAAFSCISKLGRNGCGLEQQLEAMLKALTPAESQQFNFSRETKGHGTGENAGFLREDAVLAVVHISDEDDCSLPDESSGLFDALSPVYPGEINTRCGLADNQEHLHAVERYVDGLLALKPPAYRDRIVFASIVGVPLAEDSGAGAHSGEEALSALLARPDMMFEVRRNEFGTADEPVPTCVSPSGDGSAAPGRRFVELAASFGDNGVVSSICDDDYHPLIAQVSERIAEHLGDCD